MTGTEENPFPKGNDLFRFRRCLDFLSAQGVEIEPDSEWLDLGCNQGQFLRMLVRMHKVRHWYPTEQRHKIIYRGPYVKGPADKPLLGGEVVRSMTR